MQSPLVSAVMVTGKDARRNHLAQASLRSFLQQDWPQRELVIVNDGLQWILDGYAEGEPMYREHVEPQKNGGRCVIREFRLPPTGLSLGALRNVGLDKAQGCWIVQWDDDDWHHETFITHLMAHAEEQCAVVLRDQVRYSFPSDCGFVYHKSKPHEGIHGTVLHHRRDGLRYEEIGKHEDSHFLNTYFAADRLKIIDNHEMPHLYLRFYHGSNTWHERHIMQRHGERPQDAGKFYMPTEAEWYVRQVLAREYGRPS